MKTWQVMAVMLGMIVTVAGSFGLGFVLRDRTADEKTVVAQATGTAAPSVTPSGEAPDFDLLGEIYGVLERDFVDPSRVEPSQAMQGAITGLLGTLNDPHSVYIDPQTFRITGGAEGSYQGIGASVDQRNNEIIIVQPFPGSPAEQAGIKAGDAILAVDGESTDGWTVNEGVSRIRGQAGSDVRLRVRHEDGTEEELTVTRGEIRFDTVGGCPDAPNPADVLSSQITVDCPLLDGAGTMAPGIAYVYISQYTENTPDELRAVLEQIEEGDYSGLILDLRNNPGGFLNETIETTDEFINEGRILSEIDRDGNERTWDASDGGTATEIPMVVLMNENSASGSEVMAGALQDHGRAKVIGETSFGKGTVNHFVPLSDGGALYVTIGRWFTPNGTQIEGSGIKPDIEVIPSDADIDAERDAVLFRAIEYLQTGR
jgi:carboxyl-terminal processing protease